MSDIRKLMEAYSNMVSEKVKTKLKESDFAVGNEVKCKASGMQGEVVAVDPEEKGKYYTVELENGKKMKYAPEELELVNDDDEEDEDKLDEAKKLDPVDKSALKKDFDKRADKDIDNDGDVDSSDEYLHKRRQAISKDVEGDKKPADDDKKKKDKNPKTSDNTAEISKIESVNTRESFEELWSVLEQAMNQKKGSTAPEEIDSKASPKEKEFKAKHTLDKAGVAGKKLSDADDPEKPSKTVKTEMHEFEVIRALLSGKLNQE
jgi:hypothetical protein